MFGSFVSPLFLLINSIFLVIFVTIMEEPGEKVGHIKTFNHLREE